MAGEGFLYQEAQQSCPSGATVVHLKIAAGEICPWIEKTIGRVNLSMRDCRLFAAMPEYSRSSQSDKPGASRTSIQTIQYSQSQTCFPEAQNNKRVNRSAHSPRLQMDNRPFAPGYPGRYLRSQSDHTA